MIFLRNLGLAAALAMIAGSAVAAPEPRASWGKAGISAAQYRADALECARQGYDLDISATDDAQAFVRGSRELDDATQGAGTAAPGADPVETSVIIANQQEQIRRSVQPERRMAHIRALMEAAVSHCLSTRGYVRFALTEDQRHHLGQLRSGSDQRRAYLWTLASDPAVLAQQRISDPAPR